MVVLVPPSASFLGRLNDARKYFETAATAGPAAAGSRNNETDHATAARSRAGGPVCEQLEEQDLQGFGSAG